MVGHPVNRIMNKTTILLLCAMTAFSACTCRQSDDDGLPADRSTIPAPAPSPKSETTEVFSRIPFDATWQIQYTDEMDYGLDVDVYNLDLFDTDSATIAQLHARGIYVMCYFSAGSYEDWRPDVDQFPPDVLGKSMADWKGETWLDVRRIDLLKPVMGARLDLAQQKGCDGVDPDNVNGYENVTGFPLTSTDQAAYNIFLSTQAHARGLSIGLKNDLEQIPELLPFFDWALNEECFYYKECHLLLPFIEAGKPVFVIEYQLTPEEFCFQARDMKFNALQKNWELDAYRFSCN